VIFNFGSQTVSLWTWLGPCLLFVASLVAAAPGSVRADRQAHALAALSVTDAEDRLVLDWATVLRHNTFYKAVFRPAVLRANRTAEAVIAPTVIYPRRSSTTPRSRRS
jgi:hypothetical protein